MKKPTIAQCRWCGSKFSTRGIRSHENYCKKNPNRLPTAGDLNAQDHRETNTSTDGPNTHDEVTRLREELDLTNEALTKISDTMEEVTATIEELTREEKEEPEPAPDEELTPKKEKEESEPDEKLPTPDEVSEPNDNDSEPAETPPPEAPPAEEEPETIFVGQCMAGGNRTHFIERSDVEAHPNLRQHKKCPMCGSRIRFYKEPKRLKRKPSVIENPDKTEHMRDLIGICKDRDHFFDQADRDAGLTTCPQCKTDITWFKNKQEQAKALASAYEEAKSK